VGHCCPAGGAQYKGILAIATLASIVGSQALLTGVVTILKQASELSLFPFFKVAHTSVHYEHQIHSPAVTAAMAFLCLFLLGTFQHSSNLTAVYGAAVSTAMLVTTILYAGVAAFSLKLRLIFVIAIVSPLLFMDASIASANVGKFFVSGPVQLSYPGNTYEQLATSENIGAMGPVPQNAWVAMVPLCIAVMVTFGSLCWLWGSCMTLLHQAKLSAFLLYDKPFDANVSLRTATLETGAHSAETDDGEGCIVCVPAHTGSFSDLVTTPSMAGGGRGGGEYVDYTDEGLDEENTGYLYTISAGTLRKELMEQRRGSLAQRYSRLETALGRLAAAGNLQRTRGVGVYLSSGASFYDTEPVESPDESCVLVRCECFRRLALSHNRPAHHNILCDAPHRRCLPHS
jgi:hypothetical protein